jgi:hypothetical protein
MSQVVKLPAPRVLRQILSGITERLARELAAPAEQPPDWSHTQWQLARAVAAMHGVSPLLATRLRWQGPPHWQAFLNEQRAHVLARHERIEELLSRIDSQARAAGLPFVGLKGAALHAMGLYSAGERPMADVDILVLPQDAAQITTVLASLGFTGQFANWRHGVFLPSRHDVHSELGEHAENYLKIEVHTRIAERLPLRITEITERVWPRTTCSGLNPYTSQAALMLHLLLHAAGSMPVRALRTLHLHDIALLSSRMTTADWNELLSRGQGAQRLWWALPPLQLTAHYYPAAVPADVLAALAADCPWTLRQITRRQCISDVSLSYPWVEAFPGVGWSQSLGEIVQYMAVRLWPTAEARRQRTWLAETDQATSHSHWGRLSQRQRTLQWITSRPVRVTTQHAIRMALAS